MGKEIDLNQNIDHYTAIDFVATGLNGKPFSGSTLKGKVVLLDFWAVWCAPCIDAFPVLNRLHNNYNGSGLEVLGIAAFSGDYGDVGEFLENFEVQFPVAVADVGLIEKFSVIGYPTYFLLDTEGNIHKKYVGESSLSNIEADISLLLKNNQ